MASNAPIHTLVTAGPTREKIDAVRDWGNIFSGQTGLDLALSFLQLGNVTLLTSNGEHAREFDGYSGKGGMLGVETFKSHSDLRQLLEERMTNGDRVDVVAMTAAVAVYRPEGVYRIVSRREDSGQETWVVERIGGKGEGKFKSATDEVAVLGERTEKLVDMFRSKWEFKGVLIKFKLEVGLTDAELLSVAGASRVASAADLMVANTLEMARPADASKAGAYLIDDKGSMRVARAQLAGTVVDWAARRLKH